MKLLSNKVALVTGASGNIGRAIALRLADEGASIILTYLRDEKAAELAHAEVEKRGVKGFLMQANLNEPSNIKALFSEVEERCGLLDIFIHGAALGSFRPLNELSTTSWEVTMNVNARAFLLCAKLAKPLMKNRCGIMVAVSSMGSQRYVPSYGAVGISKAALEAIVRYLAVEYAPLGIRVNAVSGGPIETEALRKFTDFPALKQSCVGNTPEARLGSPEDLADVVLFLCSNASRWIVGQTLVADGGMSLIYGYFRQPNGPEK